MSFWPTAKAKASQRWRRSTSDSHTEVGSQLSTGASVRFGIKLWAHYGCGWIRAHARTRAHTYRHTHTHTQLTANLNSTRATNIQSHVQKLTSCTHVPARVRAGNTLAADLHSNVSPRPKRSSSGSIYLITPATRRISVGWKLPGG